MADGGISTGNPFDGVWAHCVPISAGHRTRSTVKKLIVFTLFAVLLSANAHADYDPVLEAREAAERKAEQQRAAKKKTEGDKMMREASAAAYRKELGKEAVGKSDAEVTRIYKQRQNAAVQQAQAVEAAMKSSERQPKKTGDTVGDTAGMAQGDAAMKAIYGKSVTDIGNMSEKEREAFMKAMEKQYGK